jgi:phosphoribosylcarboxyaminoimidazole (NCAIR) mutase
MYHYALSTKERGLEVIIAGAGGAAHLPGKCDRKNTCMNAS